MDHSPSIVAARAKLIGLPGTASWAKLPDHIQGAVLSAAAATSPVEAMVDGMEALWAARKELLKDGREVLADLAHQVIAGGFHGDQGRPARAEAILDAIRHDHGELTGKGRAEYPEPDERFRPPPELAEA